MHLRNGLRRWRVTVPLAAIVAALVVAATAVAGDTGVSPTPFGTPTGNITDPGQNITAVRGDRLWEWTEQTRSEVLARHGVVVDCQGDAMFAAFRSAPSAVGAAAAAQQGHAQEQWPDGTRVRVRMALHTGEPHLTADGGYTGIDVVRAARLCAAGHGGQVLMTETTRSISRAETIDLGSATLPDMDGPERVYQLVVPGVQAEFPPLRRTAASPLETIEHGDEPFDQRIDRVSKQFEERVNNFVADQLERAFTASPPWKKRKDG